MSTLTTAPETLPCAPDAASLRAAGLFDIRQAGLARRLEARREFLAGESGGHFFSPYERGTPQHRAWKFGIDAGELLLRGHRFDAIHRSESGHPTVIEAETAEQFGPAYRVHPSALDVAGALNRRCAEEVPQGTGGIGWQERYANQARRWEAAGQIPRAEFEAVLAAEIARIREECRQCGAADPVATDA